MRDKEGIFLINVQVLRISITTRSILVKLPNISKI